jgi:glyoxylate reductase
MSPYLAQLGVDFMSARIFVTRELFPEVMEQLKQYGQVTIGARDRDLSREELLEGIRGKDAILCMLTDRIDAEVMEACPGLRVISNYAVGYNNIDVAEATKRGIPVTNTPDVLTEATADLTWALLLDVARRVTEGDRFTRSGRWHGWDPRLMLGKDVFGSTLGIIGFGRIGRAVARRARGFDMRVLYCSRTRLTPQEEKHLGVVYRPLNELLAESDFVSLHAPYTPETHHLIGEAELRRMKRTAYLINTARGPLVDERALVRALQEGEIAGAGLDVYENEPRLAEGLKELEQVVLAPHLGSATLETRMKMAKLAAENLLSVLRGEKPPHLVNPEVWE